MSSEMYSARLVDALGLLPMRRKGSLAVTGDQGVAETVEEPSSEDQSATAADHHQPQLDKHEFRLLVNMLKAIGHDCQYDHVSYDGREVRYQLDQLTLVFNDLNQPDDARLMNLASLADIISNPQLKRPVWEKLKTLKPS
jgi:hypothetical protein